MARDFRRAAGAIMVPLSLMLVGSGSVQAQLSPAKYGDDSRPLLPTGIAAGLT